jgi:hypothetical protein
VTYRPVALLVGGVLLLQLAWIFAVPPFRGSDEFDHAFRAAAVARGQWEAPPAPAIRGTGAWVDAPPDLVEAAKPECERLGYTVAAECVGSRYGSLVRVASGAGRYNPVFYAAIGLAGMPFSGTTSLYAMRLLGAALCLVFLALAAVATRAWASTSWPFAALALACTPVLLYSTVVAAPNGLEMASALAFWCALVGLLVRRDDALDRRLLLIACASAAVLVTLRSLGPLWCALAAVTILAARAEPRRVRQILAGSRGWVALVAVTAATVASVAWTRSMGSLVIGELPNHLTTWERITETAKAIPLWVLQSIAAFPLRDESTSPVVYLVFLGLGGWFLGRALRRSDRRSGVALVAAAAVSVLVPALITFSTMNRFGVSWQGRYGLAYSVGVLVLAGAVLDRDGGQLKKDVWIALGAVYAVAQAIGPFLVTLRERRWSPGVADGAWVLVPPFVIAVLAFVGAATVWAAASSRQDERQEVPDDRPQRERGVVGVGG